MSDRPVCVILGYGPGNGAAFARRFADEGYAVALLSRSTDASSHMAARLPEARAWACDAADPVRVATVLADVADTFGPIDVLVYNAGSGVFGDMESVEAADLELAWRINTLGLFVAAGAVTPSMTARGSGTILVVGATASLRGGAKFAAFAQAKGAQKNLAESMARHLAPKGVHVALLILDGPILSDRARAWMPDRPEDGFLHADSIASAAWSLVQQPRTAWTFQLDLRSWLEPW